MNYSINNFEEDSIYNWFSDGLFNRFVQLWAFGDSTDGQVSVPNPWDPLTASARLFIEVYDYFTSTYERGQFRLDTFTLISDPNSPPIADAGADQLLHCVSRAGATTQLDGSGISDPDNDSLTYTWSVAAGSDIVINDPTAAITTAEFPLGVHEVTLTVDDGNGGIDSEYVMITVVDESAPVASVTTDIGSLWPANHEMMPVSICVTASDDCWGPDDLIVICHVSSDQPDDSTGDGSSIGDVDGLDGYTSPVPVSLTHVGDGKYMGELKLRAERQGGIASGRTYSVLVSAADASGNVSSASTVVVVPHDRRKK